MQELVEYIVKSIVNNPDQVRVNENRSGTEVSLMLTVAPEDMGVVIGRGGQTIKSIRKLLAVRAMAENCRVYLQLSEPEGAEAKQES